jgi:hypothetical protein
MDNTDKTLYQQKKQAQIDEWKAEVQKLKAKASGASADAQIALHKQVETLESTLQDAKAKLAVIGDASTEKWESIKAETESSWDGMKSSFREAADKLRETTASV